MDSQKSALIRAQLGATLEKMKAFKDLPKPSKGWIRAMRQALGMSGRQLAKRLKVAQPSVADMESSEKAGNISLQSLQKAAEALDCRLVYAFIPKQGLEETVRKRAEKVAAHRLSSVSHSMLLEAQSLSKEEEAKMLKSKTEELTRTLPRWLWDDP